MVEIAEVNNPKSLEAWLDDWRMARSDNEVWKAGPVAVAEEFARLQEKDALLAQVRELKRQMSELRADQATLIHRSHNQPPELVEVEAKLQRPVTVIGDLADEAETELEKPAPDPTVLARIGKALLKAVKEMALYVAFLSDSVRKKPRKSSDLQGQNG